MSLLSEGPERPECSRAGCRLEATWAVNWRNPRIHAADRVKVWLACDEHAPWLRDYLAARSFPVELTAFPQTLDALPEDAS